MIFAYAQEPIIFTDLHANATLPILRYQAEQRGLAVDIVEPPQTAATRIPARPQRSRVRMLFNLLRNRWYWEGQFWRIAVTQQRSICFVLLINEGLRTAALVDRLRTQSQHPLMIGLLGGTQQCRAETDRV